MLKILNAILLPYGYTLRRIDPKTGRFVKVK